MFKKFPFYQQLDQMDCGPTCLRMIAEYYGKSYSLQFLRERCYIDREGVSLMGISDAAESIGMRTLAIKVPYDTDDEEEASLLQVDLPCIAHWRQRHFIVVYKMDKKFVWAKAIIEGEKVKVWSEKVSSPQHVRYGWADNPDDANLYNKEGLPASPFRTDKIE